MKCNVGKTDRMLRVLFGALIVMAGIAMQSWWGAVGLVPIITGLVRWCPAYVPFRIITK